MKPKRKIKWLVLVLELLAMVVSLLFLSESAQIEPAPPSAPKIVAIDFPAHIEANGERFWGQIHFEAARADVIQVEIEVVQALDVGGRDIRETSDIQDVRWDPGVQGLTEGKISFSIRTQIEQAVTIAVTLTGDETGQGLPQELSWNSIPPGSLKWKFVTGDVVSSSPAIGKDGTVYFGSFDGSLYALNPDGSLKWRYWRGDDPVHSSPAIGEDGIVYFGSSSYLYALKPDGSLKWKYRTGNYVRSSPAIGEDGTVYFGSFDGSLYALKPDGSLKWKYQIGGIASSPAIGSNGTIYVGSVGSYYDPLDGYLYAVNSNGSLKWRFHTGGPVHSSPAIGEDGTVYIGSNYYLYALNPDGSLKWRCISGVLSSPTIGADGTIYFGSYRSLYALNLDGSLKWKYRIGDIEEVYSSPAIGGDGTVYFGSYDVASDDGYLYALSPDGSLKWKYRIGVVLSSSPAIGSDGTIYVGSYDNHLYAIWTDSGGLADTPWPMFHHDLQHNGRVGGP